MNPKQTDLGTDEIHKRHSVRIESNQKVPRAIVMDQMIIDRYLMEGLLTIVEHQSGEYILECAAKAGMFAKGSNWEDEGGRGKMDNVPLRIFPFGRLMSKIKKRYGSYTAFIVCRTVCDNVDVKDNEYKMGELKKGLNYIADSRLGGGRNPLKKLKRGSQARSG